MPAPPTVTNSPTPPVAPAEGDLWFNTTTGREYVWYIGPSLIGTWVQTQPSGSAIVPPAPPPAPPVQPPAATPFDVTRTPTITVSPLPPTFPLVGDLWWSPVTGQQNIWYDDGNTTQWVIANWGAGKPGAPGPPGGVLALSEGPDITLTGSTALPVVGVTADTFARLPLPTSFPPSGAAGGALSGTYPNPGLAVPYPTTLPPSGAAGGALAGTYPNPTLVGGPLSNYITITAANAAYAPIVHSHPSTQITDFAEAVDDRVAGLIVGSTNITVTYNDVANTLTLAAVGLGTGSVTTMSVVSVNGFAGTVATPTSTPAITLSTSITGLLKGNGTALLAAVAGTDYMTPANVSAAYQPLDAELTALAGLNATAGLVEQTGAAAFTKRLIGVSNATDVLTRANGDARYAPISVAFDGQVTAGGLTVTPTNGADQVMIFATVQDGNAGAWYNAGNGRYTPPAGRYFMQVCASWGAPAGGNGTWTLKLFKNNTMLASNVGSGSASFAVPITLGLQFNANGTDFFDFRGLAASAGMTNGGGTFTAFKVG